MRLSLCTRRTIPRIGPFTAVFAFSVVAFTAMSGSASAAVGCTFDGATGAVQVDVTIGTEDVSVGKDLSTSEIKIGDGYFPGNVACTGGTPTLENTSAIDVDDAPGNTARLVLHLNRGFLGPGTGGPSEAGGYPEIEVSFDGYDSVEEWGDAVLVTGGAANDNWRLGAIGEAAGADLNADGDRNDLSLVDVESFDLWSGLGNDTVSSDGRGGFSGPLDPAYTGRFVGSDGDDVLRAGAGKWFLVGDHTSEIGDDTLIGGTGSDELQPGLGDDLVNGKRGRDTCDYTNTIDALAIDLRINEAQQTRGAGLDRLRCENLNGGDGDDRLIGNAKPNVIKGGAYDDDPEGGKDTIVGKLGRDRLFGEAGIDKLVAKDGVADRRIDCGDPDDPETAVVDGRDPNPVRC